MKYLRNNNSAFTLVEVVLGATATGLILLSTISFFTSLTRDVVRPDVVFGGITYSAAPYINNSSNTGYNSRQAVLNFHLEFSRRLAGADMVYVYGGSSANPSGPDTSPPVTRNFISTGVGGLGKALSNLKFSTNPNWTDSPLVTPYLQSSASTSPHDFTVILSSSSNSVFGRFQIAVEVRRYTSTLEGKAIVLYYTQACHNNQNPGTSGYYTYTPSYIIRYCFWIPAEEDVWAVPVGAKHYWYRRDTSWWDRTEPAGSSIVFPDPLALSVASSDVKVKPMSRFSYFVNTFSP